MIFFCLSAQSRTVMMVIPLPHYGNNFATKNFGRKKCVGVPPPPPHPPPPPPPPCSECRFQRDIFCQDCGSVVTVSITYLMWCDMVMVWCCLVFRGGGDSTMLWDSVGLNVVGWGWGKRWDTSYTAQTHIHRKLIINSSDHQQFLCWGTSRSAKMDSQILAQPNFHTLYKSGQCLPKHELFSDLLGVI